MLIFQEITVRDYWPNPIALLSWSACFGVFLTGLSMCHRSHRHRPYGSVRYKSCDIFVDLPDGGRRPFVDPVDAPRLRSGHKR